MFRLFGETSVTTTNASVVKMSLTLILIIIVLILLLSGGGYYGRTNSWAPAEYGSGMTVLFIVLLVLRLLGVLPGRLR